jgi:hypothetical protein
MNRGKGGDYIVAGSIRSNSATRIPISSILAARLRERGLIIGRADCYTIFAWVREDTYELTWSSVLRQLPGPPQKS